MHLGQIEWNGSVTAAIFEGECARPIPEYDLFQLITRSEKENQPLSAVAARLATSRSERRDPLIPLKPREVWACGCTYETSASFRDAEHGTREGFYAHVHREPRPEIFFKGTARTCVGPGEDIGIRPDSRFTAPEPELAVILGNHGRVLGYTLANDVSAWDIERGGSTIFSGATSTSKLNRPIETLIEYLLRANPVPCGSVLLTGTGIFVTEEAALAPGDKVSI